MLRGVHGSRRSKALTIPSVKGQRRAFRMCSRTAQWKSNRCAVGSRQVGGPELIDQRCEHQLFRSKGSLGPQLILPTPFVVPPVAN